MPLHATQHFASSIFLMETIYNTESKSMCIYIFTAVTPLPNLERMDKRERWVSKSLSIKWTAESV